MPCTVQRTQDYFLIYFLMMFLLFTVTHLKIDLLLCDEKSEGNAYLNGYKCEYLQRSNKTFSKFILTRSTGGESKWLSLNFRLFAIFTK